MPTYAELQAESWWGRETVTPELQWVGDELCRFTGQPQDAWGDKGNNRHLNGGHRSQEWILNSQYCTNRTYTVQPGLTAEQLRHIAAGDWVPDVWGTTENRRLMVEQTTRLWNAAKAGQLNGITQVQGTLDGVHPIGLNVLSGSTMTPDSSHLEHWHVTFDRRFLRDAGLMTRLVNIVLGILPQGDDMFCNHGDRNSGKVWVLRAGINKVQAFNGVPEGSRLPLGWDYDDQTAAALLQIGCGNPDNGGKIYGPGEHWNLESRLREIAAKEFGKPGPRGEDGKTPTKVELRLTADVIEAI